MAEAHRRGIRVLFDLINNQVHDQHEYLSSHPEWFRRPPESGVCGIDPGWGWSERPFDCLFATYLPDINWLIRGAEDQFIDDALFWIEDLDIDGYRIDAVKHVETNSIFNLRAASARKFEQGGQRVLMLGETAVGEGDSISYGCGENYRTGYEWINAYVGPTGLDGQFDFPSHHLIQSRLLTDKLSFTDLDAVVRRMENQYDPYGVHVRFLGTHDSTRMASIASNHPARFCKWQDQSAECAAMPDIPADATSFERLKRAFAVNMTLPGIPFLYYGDEIAMAGGGDPDNRRDMIWTDELAHLNMQPDRTTLTQQQRELREWVSALGQARKASPALRRGRRAKLRATRDLYVFAYAGPDGDLAVVAINQGPAVDAEAIDIPGSVRHSASSLAPAAGTGTATLSGDSVTITLGAGQSAGFLSE